MNVNIIKDFKQCLTVSIKKVNDDIQTREHAIVQFKHIIYCMAYVLGNQISYDTINIHLTVKNILNVTKKTLVKRKNNIDYSNIEQVNNDLVNYIYRDCDKRVIAVDGTYISLLQSLATEGLKLNPKDNYCMALISTLFDTEREIPLNYHLYKSKNEREGLICQLKYLRPNDILIMDRGYYSADLLNILDEHQIKPIFRLKKNFNIIKKLNGFNNDLIVDIKYEHKTIKLRVIRYMVGEKVYYLGTTLYDENISYFKRLYWKRWKVETHFRHSKYCLSLRELKSKTINGIRQDICVHNFIFIINSFFKYLLQLEIDEGYTIN